MKLVSNNLLLSATDLVSFLNCQHLTGLDQAVAQGKRAKPHSWNPALEILSQRGLAHEQSYVDHLRSIGLDVVEIDGVDVSREAVAQTRATMEQGASIIVQAALSSHGWAGRADILCRVERPSSLGTWSYEPADTKLARETKGGAVLQLCLYSELLSFVQGVAPEGMHIITPWSGFVPETYRYADCAAYFRKVRASLRQTVDQPDETATYPDPKPHCDICRWQPDCDKRRRDDDHPCLVAGISKIQINELKEHGVTTMAALATLPLPLAWKPERGSAASYTRIREQARIQSEAKEAGALKYELLPVELGLGLSRLPAPSAGDIFLDFEGDPFVGEQGMEYLFGYRFRDEQGPMAYRGDWAFTRAAEKQAFQAFVDFVIARWKVFPDLHIYHYAPYEPAALKRMMGRYATREEEIDQMLRAGLFVDLYQVTRHAMRASVESYSIKNLEPFYGFTRAAALKDATAAIIDLESRLELGENADIPEETKEVVRAYNADDCHSAEALRNWFEERRSDLIAQGIDVPRPQPGDGAPSVVVTDWMIRIAKLIERLTEGVPVDEAERTGEQGGRWLLANLLDWHRREEKAGWWEYFRLAELPAEDLFDERAGLSGLTFESVQGGTPKAPIHRYRFPPQETDIRGGEELKNVGGKPFGKVEAVSLDDRTVDIKKRQDTALLHPDAVFAHKHIGTEVMAEALVRIAEYVIAHGIEGDGRYQAARDLLLKLPPRAGGTPLVTEGETPLDSALRLCAHLTAGVLPIQGPPGAGKTFVGANMIVELVRQGKTVGITANSHKVIRNLIDATIKIADEKNVALQCSHKAGEVEPPQHRLTFAKTSEALVQSLGNGVNVGGGTAWLWARQDAAEVLDVLMVDEAAQMSLANVLAVSQAARTVILIGDPQQLDQPMQGSHPDGADVSSLNHILDGHHTIPPDKGLFLAETWRLHPDICAFTSELFYDGKLKSRDGLETIGVRQCTPLPEPGLYLLGVPHSGNQNNSPEEALAVRRLVSGILADNPTWVDREGQERALTLDDIVIITPYNAQVFEIQKLLPGARVGTVDKFQGQEAPIAIYSTATSTHADAPRGMEFLYSLNRLNVATSRAKCASILVASPQVFDTECRTPRQIQLANAFCRYLELARLFEV